MTISEILKNKKIFKNIFNKYITREGSEELFKWLEKTDFFNAPASAKYHLNEPGGLCKHSLNVFQSIRMENIKDLYSMESIAIATLLHDVCKINTYTRKVNQYQQEYFIREEKFPFGHGEKSVFLIERFMKLEIDEALAIRFHMGVEQNDFGTSSNGFNICPLAVYTSMADFESTFIVENDNYLKKSDGKFHISNQLE